jgi:hypothetical protein
MLAALGDRRRSRRDKLPSPRALPAHELAALARSLRCVEVEPDPATRSPARGPAGADGAVLVTGSLYLLADLPA